MFSMKKFYDFFFITFISLAQTYVFFSILYPKFYINGDNEHYYNAYNVISDLGVVAGYFQFSTVGGSGTEPLSYLILYVSSQFMSYESYFLISNFIFLFTLGFLLSGFHRYYECSFVLLAFSFYIFIASGLTQRLSLAILFWMLYEAVNKRSVLLLLLSVLSHWQMILIVIPVRLKIALNSLSKLKVNLPTSFFLLLLLIVILTQLDSILVKVQYFLRGFHYDSFSVLVWPVTLLLVGYNLKKQDVYFFVILFVVAMIISSGRINILCFFYSVFALKGHGRQLLLFSLIYTPLFAYKNYIYFMHNYNPATL